MYPLIKDVGTSTDFSYIVDEIIFVSLKPISKKKDGFNVSTAGS